jgi:uncharacterized OsmC-like protein
MDSFQLKSIQAPLKQQYREDPQSAYITLHAEGCLKEGISCDVTNGKDLIKAGLHPATGGDGSLVCSAELLLEALASCAGVTLNAVSTAMDIHLDNARVLVEGDLDFRGTLGVSREAPVGFTAIRIKFEIQTKEPDKIPKLIELTERYCVVFQTLRTPPQISVLIV